jgi:hypothetical protein
VQLVLHGREGGQGEDAVILSVHVRQLGAPAGRQPIRLREGAAAEPCGTLRLVGARRDWDPPLGMTWYIATVHRYRLHLYSAENQNIFLEKRQKNYRIFIRQLKEKRNRIK